MKPTTEQESLVSTLLTLLHPISTSQTNLFRSLAFQWEPKQLSIPCLIYTRNTKLMIWWKTFTSLQVAQNLKMRRNGILFLILQWLERSIASSAKMTKPQRGMNRLRARKLQEDSLLTRRCQELQIVIALIWSLLTIITRNSLLPSLTTSRLNFD